MNAIRKIFFSFITAVCFTSCKQKKVLPTASNNKSLLWEIAGKGLHQPSYYLGTMHIMCAEDAALSENVKEIIANTHQVYLEVDLDNPSELLTGMLELSPTSERSLKDVLPSDEYERVKDFFNNYQPNVPFEVLEKQHPLILTSYLYELFLPCEKKNSVELKIVEEAYRQKKETKGL
ncbi:MAG: TraB/GumN family protein, partial [Segetibacter sp.]|nr:TraB/GumN family protein [Segetibacter sp.]